MSLLLLLLGGICLGLMVSMNGQLALYFNIFEISFIVHLIGLIILLGYIKIVRKKKISFKGAPTYVYFVGFLGVTLVATSSLCASNIGATLTMALSVIGQLIISAVIDHFGLFHVPVVHFSWKRIPAYMIMTAGLLIVIYA